MRALVAIADEATNLGRARPLPGGRLKALGRLSRSFALPLLLIVALVGCNSPQAKQSLGRESSHLRWLMRMYILAAQQGRTPKSDEEFKQFINGLDAGTRDRTFSAAGVSSADELFISERDGQPYVMVYGRPPAGVAPGLVAYEQQGADGRRYVGYSVGMVEEVDQERFDKLVSKAAKSRK